MLELSTEMPVGIFRFRSPSKFGCTVLYAVTPSCICVWSKSVNSCPDGSCPTPLVLALACMPANNEPLVYNFNFGSAEWWGCF